MVFMDGSVFCFYDKTEMKDSRMIKMCLGSICFDLKPVSYSTL